ncbi:hypothetical protein GLW05_20895 [Pontibacillus yanchengensis]|uniref:Uncharacterized protein n=1 Tax=Pontibacillus yanchengensis TaxID=462910 RepID=A0A6I5A7B3_9BACI|nr:hypothetical protein [Pontibacillus yanchengensis]MYL36032.1 hypothetical protein [Pontibacillus yanchengensis]
MNSKQLHDIINECEDVIMVYLDKNRFRDAEEKLDEMCLYVDKLCKYKHLEDVVTFYRKKENQLRAYIKNKEIRLS